MNTPNSLAWRRVVQVRDDVKTGELTLARFAADLYDVVRDRGPIQYRDPVEFFSLTYPTFNLRELVKDVVLRLQGQSDKAVRQLELAYGGGKTHTLITLYQLVFDPARLPDVPSVREFREHAGIHLPRARVACLPFDKLDVERGMEIQDPDGHSRWLKQPWSVLAYQIAGDEGLALLNGEGRPEERESAPAENLLVELLSRPAKDGLATLVLLDEVLMYVREKVADHPEWRGRMQNFFQYLTQAVAKVPRCALVVSLLASDPRKNDSLGKELSADLAAVFRREQDHSVQPVEKDDVAEILRRQFFTPESVSDHGRFQAPVLAAVKGIAAVDPATRKEGVQAEERYKAHYPFHPDLTEVLYTKWTQLEGFQRTRGILRTFALALRDAERWDDQLLISTNVFLADPAAQELSPAAREMAGVAAKEDYDGKQQEWLTILPGELEKARQVQRETAGLGAREIEQAVLATFLHSQPIGQRATTRDLAVLVGSAGPDRIQLEKGLAGWADRSWFLDEEGLVSASEDGLPKVWQLGSRPNLKQMHNEARMRVASHPEEVAARVLEEIRTAKSLTAGARAAGAVVHVLPHHPGDIEDDGAFHYAVLGPEAGSASGDPSGVARRFLQETTRPDRPRVYANAVVLAVPERSALRTLQDRVEALLAWDLVEELLKGQAVDTGRLHRLKQYQSEVRAELPALVAQTYSIVVTVGKEGAPTAFKLTVDSSRPLFDQIKTDPRSRIQETAVSAEAILPGGPYDLWRAGDTARRLKDLVGAFASVPALPKMLNTEGIWDTVKQGMESGLIVLRAVRPDRSARTWWREPISNEELREPSLEVVLPEAAELDHLAPGLLARGRLPLMWSADGGLSRHRLRGYFSGATVVDIPRGGFSESLAVPKVPEQALDDAVVAAVASGTLWLVNGLVSLWHEPVPVGVWTDAAMLYAPPSPFSVMDILPTKLPAAWKHDESTGLAIATALAEPGRPLPWNVVMTVLNEAHDAGLITLDLDMEGLSRPITASDVGRVRLSLRTSPSSPPRPPTGRMRSQQTLKPGELQDLADVIGELFTALEPWRPTLSVQLEVDAAIDAAERSRVSELLKHVHGDWTLG
jgi:hypothetical protein